MFQHDSEERRKLKAVYREARDNGTRIPGQMLYLKKSQYTPGSFRVYMEKGQVSNRSIFCNDSWFIPATFLILFNVTFSFCLFRCQIDKSPCNYIWFSSVSINDYYFLIFLNARFEHTKGFSNTFFDS